MDYVAVCFPVLFAQEPRRVCVRIKGQVPFLGSLLVTGVVVARGGVVRFPFVAKAGAKFEWEGDVKSPAPNILTYAAVVNGSGVQFPSVCGGTQLVKTQVKCVKQLGHE